MKKIKHRRQINDKTCTSACIAMLLDIPVEEVVEEFHEAFFDGRMRPACHLRLKGLHVREFASTEREILVGLVYLLTVPSLGRQGYLHSVICDARDGFEIIDPQKGREDSKYYVSVEDGDPPPDDPNAVALKGYVIDAEIVDYK